MVRRATKCRGLTSPHDLKRTSLITSLTPSSHNDKKMSSENPQTKNTISTKSSEHKRAFLKPIESFMKFLMPSSDNEKRTSIPSTLSSEERISLNPIEVPMLMSWEEIDKKLQEIKNSSEELESWWKDLYEGQWVYDLFDEFGTIVYNEEEEIGTQKSPRQQPSIEGYKVVGYPNGDVYAGEWQGGQRHGIGKLTFGQGVGYYDGEWKNGCFDGVGIFCWIPSQMLPIQKETAFSAAHCRYEGQFKNGSFHGVGRLYGTDGILRKEGMWENGSFRHSVVIHVAHVH